MIDATNIFVGCAFLIPMIFGIHQSSGLSEINSQFHDASSVEFARFCIERRAESVDARRNFVLGPATLTTGCSPIVFVTTPPQPASKARMMLLSDSVGGADESRYGFSKCRPVNETSKRAPMADPRQERATIRPGRRDAARAGKTPEAAGLDGGLRVKRR